MRQEILNNLKNLYGWRTRRKIVVFSVDDYGNVRVDSAKARVIMDKAGLKIHSRFDAFDSLETLQDLEMLFEALSSVKDKNDNHAQLTAFTVPVNINFEKMEAEDYQKYEYELLPETYSKLSEIYPAGYSGAWSLWKEGMDRNLIHPEFHGREHFNLKVFNEKLAAGNRELLTVLKNRSLTSISGSGYPTISFTAAFEFDRVEENMAFEMVIKDGLNAFEKIFGFRASHFNPPGGREHPAIHHYLKEGGIQFLDTPFIKSEHQGEGKHNRNVNYTGKMNKEGQVYQVRNCVFEPTDNRGFDWVNFTFKQVEAAFRWNRPAIISSHRVNFCGHIDPKNREKGISALRELLKKITTKYPDVEFMSSSALGKIILKDKRAKVTCT